MKLYKIIDLVIVIIAVMIVFQSVAFAKINTPPLKNGDVPNLLEPKSDDTNNTTIRGITKNIVNIVLRVISYVAYGVALGMAVYIGIKFMMTGAGEKAKVKETLLPYLIGALIVGSASTMANMFISL